MILFKVKKDYASYNNGSIHNIHRSDGNALISSSNQTSLLLNNSWTRKHVLIRINLEKYKYNLTPDAI